MLRVKFQAAGSLERGQLKSPRDQPAGGGTALEASPFQAAPFDVWRLDSGT